MTQMVVLISADLRKAMGQSLYLQAARNKGLSKKGVKRMKEKRDN